MRLIDDVKTDREKIESLLDTIQEICSDIRERSAQDWVCGLCEYDGPAWQECPGFERDDCFCLREDFREKYLGGKKQ